MSHRGRDASCLESSFEVESSPSISTGEGGELETSMFFSGVYYFLFVIVIIGIRHFGTRERKRISFLRMGFVDGDDEEDKDGKFST